MIGLSWAGHVARIENSKKVKKVLDNGPEENRKIRKPN
jgi:hypothetical protein